MGNIEAIYRAKTRKSADLYSRASRRIAGGGSRTTAMWLPYPLVLTGGQGTLVDDVDGNSYIDLTGNYGSLVHGHAYPPVVEAVERQLRRGTQWAAGSIAQVELAELLAERIPSVERLRFTNSGSEATSLALTVARLATGRPKLLMARDGYHGSAWEFSYIARSGVDPADPHITLTAEFNDPESFERVLAEHGKDIAAVFIEPVAGVGGIVAASMEFLTRVKAAAQRAGAVFVLDEVLTFRLGIGGRQGVLGFEPDLTTLGKIIGGGFPVGAVAGRDELMQVFERGRVPGFEHSGTYNANPVSMIAGAVTVRELTQVRLDQMERQAETITEQLRMHSRAVGLTMEVGHVGSLIQYGFTDPKLVGQGVDGTDANLLALFHLAALDHGVFVAPRGMIALSTVLTDAQVNDIVARLAPALADVAAAAGILPSRLKKA